jgi:hypothetical protein
MTIVSKALVLSLIGGAAITAACDRGGGAPIPPAAPPVDPWKHKLETLEAEFKANDVRLRAEWRATLDRASMRDLDADVLAGQIEDLIASMKRHHDKLREWDQELTNEIETRGLSMPQ